MRKIIWLCSWYPNDIDKFRGDFVQRQAQAVSWFAKIHVVHVVMCDYNETITNTIHDTLKETIIYLKKKNRISDFFKFKNAHQHFLSEYIQSNGKPDLVHVQIPMKAGIIALQWKKKNGLQYVLTEHYGIYNSLIADNYEKRNFLFKYFSKKIFEQAKIIMPVSNVLGREIQEIVTPKPFVAISNVVDERLFFYVNKSTNHRFRFIHISDLSEVKNPYGMIVAIYELSKIRNDFEVLFIGSMRENVVRKVNEYDLLNNVIFIKSEMSYHQIAIEVRDSDAGLLFSKSESQSCVVLEWLCAGLPVIASRVGGVVELIDSENGILVDSEHIVQLTNAMNHMVDNYGNYNQKQISEKALSKYSYESVGQKIVAVYQKIIQKS